MTAAPMLWVGAHLALLNLALSAVIFGMQLLIVWLQFRSLAASRALRRLLPRPTTPPAGS